MVNLNLIAFNKQLSGLIVKCFEIPHYAYYHRYGQFNVRRQYIDL